MTASANTTPIFAFGSGSVYAFASGKTPVKLGVLQDIEIDVDSQVKELFGQNQFAVAVGRGQTKISGKAKMGQFDGHLLTSLMFNTSLVTGFPDLVESEAQNVPGSTTYTVQVTNHTGFLADLGVYYSATTGTGVAGMQLEQVTAGAEAQGKYSVAVATGTYTFHSSDASAALLFNYSYTNSTGHSTVINNQAMGAQPVFQLFLKEAFTNFGVTSYITLSLNRCISSKFTAPFKNTDFAIPDFDFSAFVDASGNVGTWGFST